MSWVINVSFIKEDSSDYTDPSFFHNPEDAIKYIKNFIEEEEEEEEDEDEDT